MMATSLYMPSPCSPRIEPSSLSRTFSHASASDAIAQGRRVFETTACVNCHTASGTVANGHFGPDLTHFMSRDTIAAGAAANTPQNLRLWIQNPDAIKPGSLMPAMQLSDQDLEALTAYLETLR